MSFTLETGVPLPSRRNRYPFADMQIGTSFEIVGDGEARKVRNAAYQYAKKTNASLGLKKGQEGAVTFALRKTGEQDGAPVYRLWRE